MKSETAPGRWNHGHAIHFHERLSRLSEDQVAFAVAFYRDHWLVRRVLERLGLRPGERVAIEIGDAHPSPHLVVQSDGQFITCLAAHMSTAHLPIVSRKRLDSLVSSANEERAIEAAEQAVREDALRGFGRLMKMGPNVSRSEFVAVLSTSPIAQRVYADAVVNCAQAQMSIEERAQRRLDARDATALEAARKARFAMGHLMLTCGELLSTTAKGFPGEVLLRVALRTGEILVAAQALHVVAKRGRVYIDAYESRALLCEDPISVGETVLALAAIGLREVELKPRVLVALRALALRLDPVQSGSAHELVTAAVEAVELPHAYRRAHRDIGRTLAMRVARIAPHRSRFRWAREEDVPDVIAFPLALREREVHLESTSHFLQVLVRLPWVVNVMAESLYLEKDLLPFVEQRFCRRAEAMRLEALAPQTTSVARRGTPWVCTSRKNKRRRSQAVAA